MRPRNRAALGQRIRQVVVAQHRQRGQRHEPGQGRGRIVLEADREGGRRQHEVPLWWQDNSQKARQLRTSSVPYYNV